MLIFTRKALVIAATVPSGMRGKMPLRDTYSVIATSDDGNEAHYVSSPQQALVRYKELMENAQWQVVLAMDADGNVIDEAELTRRQRPRWLGRT